MEIKVSSSAARVDNKINLRVEINVNGVISSFTDIVVEGMKNSGARNWVISPVGYDLHVHTDVVYLNQVTVLNLTVVAYQNGEVVASTATHNFY